MKYARPYQLDCFEAISSVYRKQKRRVIVELATGTGKTVIFSLLTKRAAAKGGKVLILVNRDVLVTQAIEELNKNGVHCYREQAGERAPITANVVVGSIQSMTGKWLQKWHPENFRFVILDECHGSSAKTFRQVLDHFGSAFHLGVTATAERHDKKGLWSGYEDIVYRMPLRTWTDPETGIITPGAQNEGWLVNFQFEELPVPILLDDKVAAGDFKNEDQANEVFEKSGYLKRLFLEASEAARGAKGLAFLPGCSASEECAKEMRKAGINAQHIDGFMSKAEIARLLQWFKETKDGILCNADLLSVGYNEPSINWLGMFRIVRSTPMYKQRLGRGTRALADVDSCATREERLAAIAASSKPFCRVIDLMIQNENHNLATPSCLITDDPEELQALNESRKSGKPFDMSKMDEELGKIRIVNANRQLEKLATDAANSAEKRRNYSEPWYKHILHGPRNGAPASPAAMGYLKSLGYTGPTDLTKQQAFRITELFKKHKQAA